MDLPLVNIEVPDLAAAVAFGPTVIRRPAADEHRPMSGIGPRSISMSRPIPKPSQHQRVSGRLTWVRPFRSWQVEPGSSVPLLLYQNRPVRRY